MKLTQVESSGIQAVGYDPHIQILVVVFRKGPVYRYLRVPEEVYEGLMKARSKGKFFLTKIRGAYEHQEVDLEPNPREHGS